MSTTESYTLSLHDALPIFRAARARHLRDGSAHELHHAAARGARETGAQQACVLTPAQIRVTTRLDRKSTRLNSSHQIISYAVFCLKQKRQTAASGHAVMHG